MSVFFLGTEYSHPVLKTRKNPRNFTLFRFTQLNRFYPYFGSIDSTFRLFVFLNGDTINDGELLTISTCRYLNREFEL
ncbi:unnamed protein product [Lactuca virosa]|uniref:Uncharacterized protein n=1 Tax=Lactuca virosa TaxID=75947 RepID=A0AAU9MN30_9ASTR|nr:unnamed protein product [Lactuca virosa]